MKDLTKGFVATTFAMVMIFLAVPVFTAVGQDMREAHKAVEARKADLLRAVAEEKAAAQKDAQETRARIVSDKAALASAVNDLEARAAALETENAALEKQLAGVIDQENRLSQSLAEADAVLGELTGVIRLSARDLKSLVAQNFQTAFHPEQLVRLESIADQSGFPGMGDIRDLVDLYFMEMVRSGEVRLEKGPLVLATGDQGVGDILVIGNFTAAYRTDDATGFLDYTPDNQKLAAFTKSPGRGIKNKIKAYMDGKAVDVPIDISRGGALRQMVHGTRLLEKIPQGGPIVWPILAIFAFAMGITIERLVVLSKKKINAQDFMDRIYEYVFAGKWEDCRRLCESQNEKPLAKVILAGLTCRDGRREDMENAVQEAILREIPPLEKFLSTLGMLAAIAPLLGLLGTVTGMINTFHMITYFGTGDPRMMSGGISEALVTTMLGLMAAIPIMFVHNLLSRRVENSIGEMEEKSVSFINRVFKARVQQ